MSTEVARVLREARALIDSPDKWCQGRLYEVQFGKLTRCCVLGAINEAAQGDLSHAYIGATDALRRVAGPDIVYWNDAPATTHDAVMRAFDRAIASAESTPTPMTEGA
jgi:hypothetical protein